MQTHRDTAQRVLQTGLIGERDGEGAFRCIVSQMYARCSACDLVGGDPNEGFRVTRCDYHPFLGLNVRQQVVEFVQFARIGWMDPNLGLCEELQLFDRLRLVSLIFERLIMCAADVGEHADRWPNDGLQLLHLTRLADTRFENTERVLRPHAEHAQWHAHLAVPTAGAAHDVLLLVQHLPEPLLHNGLAVAARYADHRDVEVRAVPSGEALKSSKRVLYKYGVHTFHR